VKAAVVFGTGDVAQIAAYYFERDQVAEVVAFTVDQGYLPAAAEFDGRPVVPFETLEATYPPDKFAMFIALSYSRMNRVREEKFVAATRLGYELLTYISPDCTFRSEFKPGRNCFIFEDNTVQPFVRIGDNVTFWSGNHIGHHSVFHDHVFVSSHVVISGHCTVESHCFLGVNSTVAHGVRVADGTLLGAGAVLTKDSERDGVYVPARTVKLDRSSSEIEL
jgi:sugar O-acyltransferase (sialic acid O-acetyltransferase NeuD family)